MLQVILICLLGMLGAEATDYTKAGPYGAQKDYYGYVMPTSTGCRGWSCHIKLTVTRPTGDAVPDGIFDRSSPFPVVFMFNGFQVIEMYGDFRLGGVLLVELDGPCLGCDFGPDICVVSVAAFAVCFQKCETMLGLEMCVKC